MIFRVIHGRFKENLVVTPVIREWKIRNPDDRLCVETSFPELFVNNPNVDEVGLWFEGGPVIDFDILEESGIHPIDNYSLAAFGDARLQSRHMESYVSMEETDVCAEVLVGRKFESECPNIVEALKKNFTSVAVIGDRSIGETLTAFCRAKTYIGSDEDTSWLAMTTDIPIVMSCGPRPVKTCRPFRWLTPFEPVSWKCEWAKTCMSRFASIGSGQVFHVYCQKEPFMACERLIDVAEAVNKVLDAVKYRQERSVT